MSMECLCLCLGEWGDAFIRRFGCWLFCFCGGAKKAQSALSAVEISGGWDFVRWGQSRLSPFRVT